MKAVKSQYVALGDSMTIGEYPALDAGARYRRSFTNVGAGALLYNNCDELFPEFRGRDLKTGSESLEFVDLSSDGATLPTVESQVRSVTPAATIITLTVGGNDLLGAYWSAKSERGLGADVERISDGFDTLIAKIRAAAPKALLVLTTVYDPTDGTGRMPG